LDQSRIVLPTAPLLAAVLLSQAALAAGIPAPANIKDATDIITGWDATVHDQTVIVTFHFYDVADDIANGSFGDEIPLANLAGLTIDEVRQPSNTRLLAILLNERQGNSWQGQSGIWDIAQTLAASIGPVLTSAMEQWISARGPFTQGLAGGPIPPVPGPAAGPDPSIGVYCWPSGVPANMKPCVAAPAQIDSGGRVTWPGYPPSVTQGIAQVPGLDAGTQTSHQGAASGATGMLSPSPAAVWHGPPTGLENRVTGSSGAAGKALQAGAGRGGATEPDASDLGGRLCSATDRERTSCSQDNPRGPDTARTVATAGRTRQTESDPRIALWRWVASFLVALTSTAVMFVTVRRWKQRS
jgi:hypothetical protein